MNDDGAAEDPVNRPTVLIVEDEWLVALDLGEAVESIGCQVLGPAHSVSAALELLGTTPVDGCLLDVNLRAETSYPVAKVLTDRGIPFAFLTGYASRQLRTDFQGHPLLSKPVEFAALQSRLGLMLGEREKAASSGR